MAKAELSHDELVRKRDRARDYRRRLYDLRETARELSERLTVRTCGVWCAYGGRGVAGQGVVDFAIGPAGNGKGTRAKTVGTHACGSVWECPVCRARVIANRALEVTQFAREARARGMTLKMQTYTLRHGVNDDLEELRKVLSDAYRAVHQSTAVRARKDAEGWSAVRALEITDGPHGWHPHLHVLIAIENPLDEAFPDDGRWRGPKNLSRRRLCERAWIHACRRLSKGRNTPLQGIAVVETDIDINSADYLTKLGLEISDDSNKDPRLEGRRKPLRILEDAREEMREARARERSGELELGAGEGYGRHVKRWREYARGMVRAHCLEWGKDVRERFFLNEKASDEDLAVERADAPSDVVVLSLDAQTYRLAIAHRPGLQVQVLDAFERFGRWAFPEVLLCIAAAHGARGEEVVARVLESHRWITARRRQQLKEDAEQLYIPRRRRLFATKPRPPNKRGARIPLGESFFRSPWALEAWRFRSKTSN